MDASRILLTAVTAAREAGASVASFFDHGLGKLLELADKDPEAAKDGMKKVLGPMVGQPVLRRIDGAADAVALRRLTDDFGFASYFAAGREESEIPDELLEEALPPEAQVQLASAEVMDWLVGDRSGWWKKPDNVSHLTTVVSGIIDGDQALRSDFVAAISLEDVFTALMEDAEMMPRLARFAAGLRTGVKTPIYDTRLLEAFTLEELVRHADSDAVWDFCSDALRAAIKPAAPAEPPPPALVTCQACGARAQGSAKHCPSCGEALGASSAATAS